MKNFGFYYIIGKNNFCEGKDRLCDYRNIRNVEMGNIWFKYYVILLCYIVLNVIWLKIILIFYREFLKRFLK